MRTTTFAHPRLAFALLLSAASAACGNTAATGSTGAGGSATTSSASTGTSTSGTTASSTSTTSASSGATSSSSTTSGTGGAGACSDQVGSCDSLFTGFTACGGDPKGQWQFKSACSTATDAKSDPKCPGNKSTAQVIGSTGDLLIDATSMTSKSWATIATYHIIAPKSCLMGLSCAVYASVQGKGTCCTDDGTNCLCNQTQTIVGGGDDGMYAISGTTLKLNNQVFDFCVKNNTLSLRANAGTSNDQIQVFEPKMP